MNPSEDTEHRVRLLLAEVLEQAPEEIIALPRDTALLGSGLALDSLIGMRLLTGIQEQFGVDVAAEDLNLDSLETLGTLVDFLRLHASGPAKD